MRANRSVFESDKAKPENDEVIKAYKDKYYVNVVVCTSPSNNKQVIYPIKKEKDELGDVNSVSLIIHNDDYFKKREPNIQDKGGYIS